MIKINLLPVRDAQKKEKLREQLIILVASVTFVVLVCAAAYTTILTKIGQKKDMIAEQTKVIEQLKKQIGEVEKVKRLQGELQAKLDVLDKLKLNKTGPVHMLDELSAATPERLWIDSYDIVSDTVTLSGLGVNEEVVATFLQKIEASPYYQKVELQSLDQTVVSGNKLHRFKIVAKEEIPPVKKAGSTDASEKKSEPAKES